MNDDRKKNLVILGSTGSIGRQAVEVVEANRDRFHVYGLAARRDVRKLSEQIKLLRPDMAVLTDQLKLHSLRERLPAGNLTEVEAGHTALEQMAGHKDIDLVLNAMVGAVGLRSSIAALEAGKTLCLANKESLVVGGELVTAKVSREHQLLPVDSEHSALFQCLQGEDITKVKRLILTGSGGPFRGQSLDELGKVTLEQALDHPTWTMGAKITIDSATLMNKGLEVIEAHFLFGVPYEKIEVLIHPQSIVHSLVEFDDGSVKAQMGYPDMKLPIQYAMTYPERLPLDSTPPLDLASVGSLTFEEPDLETFACLRYALEAGRAGKTYTVALNAANEVAVDAFLREQIPFTAIAEVIGHVLEVHQPEVPDSIDTILHADRHARIEAERWIDKRG